MLIQGGHNICGIPIGVLCLESYCPKAPGHIKCPSSFRFPIAYKVIKGVTVAKLLREPSDKQMVQFIAAARELEAEGVRAITGSCGFLALYQQELADAVNIPVFASSLLQVPLVHRMLKSNQKVGVLTAHKSSLTPAHLKAVGVEDHMVCIVGMEGQPEFTEVILEGKRYSMDLDKVESEVVEVAVAFAHAHPEVGALVLECTDMPPFANQIQQKTGLPVFDLSTLTNMVGEVVNRQPYHGILQR